MKMKNKKTKVQPKSLTENPNKAIVKKKNTNNLDNKKALKNVNGNLETLVSDASVVVTSTISKKGKKRKKKKKNEKVKPVNDSNCGPQTDVTTAPKENNCHGNENSEGNVPVSESAPISEEGVKDLKGSAEIPVENKENIDNDAEIAMKDMDQKTENSKKPVIEGEAVMKDVDEKAEKAQIDISVTSLSTKSKKKNAKKKQQPVSGGEAPTENKEVNDTAETPKKDIENIEEKAENSQIDASLTNKTTTSKKRKCKRKKRKQQPVEKNALIDAPLADVSTISKEEEESVKQSPVTEGEAVMKNTEVNGDADAPMEDIDEKAENSQIDASVANTPTISKKKKRKQKNKQQQQKSVGGATSDNSAVTTEVTAEQPVVAADGDPGEADTVVKKKKKKKRKKKRKISEVESTNTSSDEKASKIAKKESEIKAAIMQKGSPRNMEEEERTIFVGNVNVKTKRRDISRFFSKFGKVETVRLRCAAVADPKKSKKVTVITGKYNTLRTSVNAYVRFKTKDMATTALEANGSELMGKHIRVDGALKTEDQTARHSVFVGNLPIEAEEETLRSHFIDCGEIHSVRIVRDSDFTSGKGFGYVNFKSADSIEFALQLNNSLFMHRQLRVQRYVKKGKNKKKNSKNVPGFVNLQKARTESNKPKGDGDFSGKKMVETKKFKKMKKAKGKLSKDDKKKRAVSHMLTGVKAKLKKST